MSFCETMSQKIEKKSPINAASANKQQDLLKKTFSSREKIGFLVIIFEIIGYIINIFWQNTANLIILQQKSAEMKKILDYFLFLEYLLLVLQMCDRGEIGRRVTLRSLWTKFMKVQVLSVAPFIFIKICYCFFQY